MKSYICWAPERGQTEDSGGAVVSADGANAAAVWYAKECCGFDSDPFRELLVHVRMEEGYGGISVFWVEVEVMPNFVAKKVTL